MNILKVIAKKIVGLGGSTKSSVELYKASGNLAHGSNCKLENLQITIFNAAKGNVNIQVGNDCYISGSIDLLSPDAKVIIGDGVFIGPGTKIFCYDKVIFENDIMVSWGCTFIDTNAHSLNSAERLNDVRDWIKGPENKNWDVVKHAPVMVKSKSWIGFNSIITKGVTVEEGTVVASGSVLTKSSEPYSVYGGNPAVFLKKTN